MRARADLHTHSQYSDGRGTVLENIQAAAALGLAQYGITDHGPHNLGVGVKQENCYLELQAEVQQWVGQFPELQVLVGAEADIISTEGDLDLSKALIQQLDLLIVGLHPYVWPRSWQDGWRLVLANQFQWLSRGLRAKVRNTNTKALVEAMAKYPVDIISHPNLKMPVDIWEVAQACAKYQCAYEINTGHNYQTVEEIKAVAKTGVTFAVNSDAHFPATIGQLEPGIKLLEQAGVAVEQTLNLC